MSHLGYIDLPTSNDDGDRVGMARTMAFTIAPIPPIPHVRGGDDAVCDDPTTST